MYLQDNPYYVQVGVPDKLMPGFKKRLDKLDPEWKRKVYSLKSQGVIIGGKKSYSYAVLSVPTYLEQKLGWLFRIRRRLWAVVHDAEFL